VILGILSDTHGQWRRTADAVRLLDRLGAEALVHCGDVGSADVLAELAGRRAWVVAGNTDVPDAPYFGGPDWPGITLGEGPLRVEVGGRRLVVFHGHETAFENLWRDPIENRAQPESFAGFEYVLHGHTHVPASLRLGAVRVINPGALHRAPRYTVATLDLAADRVRFWEVRDGRREEPPVRLDLRGLGPPGRGSR
jgi:putative phosphoesterase